MSKPTALVTGASRGLGRAIAVAFAEAGLRVGLVARSEAGLQETRQRVEARGGEAEIFVADLSVADRVAALADEVASWAGQLDVLVNNAGVIEPLGRFADVSFDAWASSVRVNLEGTARVTHALLPLLRAGP